MTMVKRALCALSSLHLYRVIGAQKIEDTTVCLTFKYHIDVEVTLVNTHFK